MWTKLKAQWIQMMWVELFNLFLLNYTVNFNVANRGEFFIYLMQINFVNLDFSRTWHHERVSIDLKNFNAIKDVYLLTFFENKNSN